MKNSMIGFLAVAILVSACGAGSSNSEIKRSMMIGKWAPLEVLQLDPKLSVGKNYGGSVVPNNSTNEITVQIDTCPLNATRIWAGPSYTANNIVKTVDGCGVVIYRAKTDARPVDGALVEIEVKDNSKSLCEIPYNYMTEVTLKTSIVDRRQGQEVSTQSLLFGKKALK